jgi:DNA-binding protein YbaB
MQERLASIQNEVGARTVRVAADGEGVSGKVEVQKITIDPQVRPSDREMLET